MGCRLSSTRSVEPPDDFAHAADGDSVKNLERHRSDIERELASKKKLEPKRQAYLLSELPKLAEKTEERRRLEAVLVGPRTGRIAMVRLAEGGSVPRDYMPQPEEELATYTELLETIRDARRWPGWG